MSAATDHRGNGVRRHGATVVVGEPDAEIRQQIARLLGLTGFEVHAVATGAEVLEATRELQPAAVVIEVMLPEISGYQICHILRNEYGREVSIVLLSGTRTEPFDHAAGLLLGADDYIAKPFSPEELVARLAAHTRASSRRANGEKLLARLTPSEERVLRLLADGLTTKEIAGELSITPKTVGMHVHNAMKKLNVHSRSQAVALAHRLGLVDGPKSGRSARGPADPEVPPGDVDAGSALDVDIPAA